MQLFRCSAGEILKQDAVLTFVLLKAGRELDRERRAGFMLDMADIAFIPSQKVDYQKELKKNYMKRAGIETSPAVQVSLTDPNLGAILGGALGQKGGPVNG